MSVCVRFLRKITKEKTNPKNRHFLLNKCNFLNVKIHLEPEQVSITDRIGRGADK